MADNGVSGTLSHKQELLIAALLAGHNLQTSAKVSGVGERTAIRWHSSPEFQTAYKAARQQAFDAALSILQDTTEESISVLRNLMRDTEAPHGIRLRAAQILLEQAIQCHKFEDIERRLEAMEAREE